MIDPRLAAVRRVWDVVGQTERSGWATKDKSALSLQYVHIGLEHEHNIFPNRSDSLPLQESTWPSLTALDHGQALLPVTKTDAAVT
jgi:hypothetical protein